MVAVRGSHLLNPKDFVIETWCASLEVSPEVRENLVNAWYYSQSIYRNTTTPLLAHCTLA